MYAKSDFSIKDCFRLLPFVLNKDLAIDTVN